jgi:NAD-dependent deacetylase
MMKELIERVARDILTSKRTIALTGAGISVESGIPDFRSPGGLWSRFDPMEYAHIDSFRRNPRKVWEMLKEVFRLISSARPNPAHYALAELESMGLLQAVITQNVDGLHQKAGSKVVIEYHGNHDWLVCLECGWRRSAQDLREEEMPPTCEVCGSILKPSVVFFGEPIPWEAQMRALEEARLCELMLVIGTSAVVYPAADLPRIAKSKGARVVEINLEPTVLTGVISDYLIEGKAGEVLPEILKEVKKRKDG